MTYEAWQLKPFVVLLRDPDSSQRVWNVNAIGPFDARSQARYQWPTSEVIEAREAAEEEEEENKALHEILKETAARYEGTNWEETFTPLDDEAAS